MNLKQSDSNTLEKQPTNLNTWVKQQANTAQINMFINFIRHNQKSYISQ